MRRTSRRSSARSWRGTLVSSAAGPATPAGSQPARSRAPGARLVAGPGGISAVAPTSGPPVDAARPPPHLGVPAPTTSAAGVARNPKPRLRISNLGDAAGPVSASCAQALMTTSSEQNPGAWAASSGGVRLFVMTRDDGRSSNANPAGLKLGMPAHAGAADGRRQLRARFRTRTPARPSSSLPPPAAPATTNGFAGP